MAERDPGSRPDKTPLPDPWRSRGLLGRGGTASVFDVRRFHEEPALALKLAHDRGCSGAILAEVEALMSLSHPAVPKLHACGVDEEGRAWLVRDAIDGRPLDEHLYEHREDAALIRDLLDQGLDLLLYLDQRARCHGDIKPANVFVDETGRRPQLRILDLGAEADVMTPAFAPPERLAVERAACLADDLFALAVSFWQGLTGEHPYPGYPASQDSELGQGPEADALPSLAPLFDFLRPLLAMDLPARLSGLQGVLRHREHLWPDAPALPLDASLRHRVQGAPFVPLAQASEGALAGWLALEEEAEPSTGPLAVSAAVLAAPKGSGRSRALAEWALRLGRSGRQVLVFDLGDPDEAQALLDALGLSDDGGVRGACLLFADHVDEAPVALRRELREAIERVSLAGAGVTGTGASLRRCLLVSDEPDAFPGLTELELAPLPGPSLEALIDAVFVGATVRPGDRENWARAHEANPSRLLRALAWALDQGSLRACRASRAS